MVRAQASSDMIQSSTELVAGGPCFTVLTLRENRSGPGLAGLFRRIREEVPPAAMGSVECGITFMVEILVTWLMVLKIASSSCSGPRIFVAVPFRILTLQPA